MGQDVAVEKNPSNNLSKGLGAPQPEISREEGNKLSKPQPSLELESGIKATFGPGVKIDKINGSNDIRVSVGLNSLIITQENNNKTVLRVNDELGQGHNIAVNSNTKTLQFNVEDGNLKLSVIDYPKDGKQTVTPLIVGPEGFEIKQEIQKAYPGDGTELVLPKIRQEEKPRPDTSNDFESKDNTSFSTENATKNFLLGFEEAKQKAAELGVELRYGGSGMLAKSLSGPEINPIEYQTISAKFPGSDEWVKIGGVLPEKEHLRSIHTSKEISSQITSLLSNHLDKGKEDTSFSTENATKNFLKGFELAQEDAARAGVELRYGGSGILVRSISGPKINPIEIQTISAKFPGSRDWVEIGGVLPEKVHLQSIHTSEEIRKQIAELLSGK